MQVVVTHDHFWLKYGDMISDEPHYVRLSLLFEQKLEKDPANPQYSYEECWLRFVDFRRSKE